MANILITLALFLTSLVLLTAGVFVYKAGIMLFGLLMGAGLGFFGTSAISLTGTPQLVAIVLLAVAGLFAARLLYYIIIVVPGAVTGFGAALFLTGTSFVPVTNLFDPVILLSPLIGGVVAVFVQDVVVVVVSASWGAALLWAAMATDEIATSLASGSIPNVPMWVLALTGVGAVVQTGIWFLTRHYDDGELRQKVLGLIRGSTGESSQPGGEA